VKNGKHLSEESKKNPRRRNWPWELPSLNSDSYRKSQRSAVKAESQSHATERMQDRAAEVDGWREVFFGELGNWGRWGNICLSFSLSRNVTYVGPFKCQHDHISRAPLAIPFFDMLMPGYLSAGGNVVISIFFWSSFYIP